MTAFDVEPWMRDLPFSNAIDLVNNKSYPMSIRVGAASVLKLIMQLTLEKRGGSTLIGTPWMLDMIARQQAESPEFAEIYASAPIITGTEASS